MGEDYIIPKRIGAYMRRLAIEYKRNNREDLVAIIETARLRVIEQTTIEGWGGNDEVGHEVILYLSVENIAKVPLSKQAEIATGLKEDLNRASSSVSGEFIEAVHFELLDEGDADAQAAVKASLSSTVDPAMAAFWEADHLRLFISHRDTHKKVAHALAQKLKHFGISSFVAHDTIEPDEEWRKEIEKALNSMEVMLALVTDDFFDSIWTNQEIGFAKGREIPVVSIKLGNQAPKGLIEERQAYRGDPNNLAESAATIFKGILKKLGRSKRARMMAINAFANSGSFAKAEANFWFVDDFDRFDDDEVEQLVEVFNQNSQINGCYFLTMTGRYTGFLRRVSGRDYQLRKSKLVLAKTPHPAEMVDSEIPF
jgi:hypothetical protein